MDHAEFSNNRDRLLTSDVAQQFFAAAVEHAKGFMSDEHFTVDGRLIQPGWKPGRRNKSFRRKDGSDDQNRNGLIAAAMATQADGLAERDAALLMLKEKQESAPATPSA